MSKTERGIALVTGASSGIGRVTAQALRRDGYRVFGTSRKPIPDAADGIGMPTCDVVDDASVQGVVDEVMSRAGRIDLLVNNAGIGLLGGAEEATAAQARALFEVNLTRPDRPLAVYDTVRADAERLMREIVATGDAPEVVAETVVRAANSASPKRRYTAGKAAGQVRFMRRFLPGSLVARNLRKFNRLPA